MHDHVRQALLKLAPLLRRRGTSEDLGKGLRRAGQQLDKVLMEPDTTAQALAVRSALAELRGALALIQQSSRAADHAQLEGTAGVLATLAPLEGTLDLTPDGRGAVVPLRPLPDFANQAALAMRAPPRAPVEAHAPAPVNVLPSQTSALNVPTDPPRVQPPAQPETMGDLVQYSFDEAESLWQLWETGLVSHARDLAGVASFVEERLDGALEGVRLAADAAFESILAPALASDSRWPLTAAAHIAATSESRDAREALLAMLGGAEGERLAAFRRALEVVDADSQLAPFEARLAAGGFEHKAALVELRAFRCRHPGAEADELLRAPDPKLRAVALHACRYVPADVAIPVLEYSLGERDPVARNAAIESGLVVGSVAAWSACLDLVRRQDPDAGPLLLLVASLGTEQHQQHVLAAFENQALRRSAILAAGFAGTAAAADACVVAMEREDDARLAAEAFCAITGLNLETEDLIEPDPPEPEEPIPFEEEDLDADLTPKPDAFLPRPRVAGVRRWWEARRARFASGTRYLAGQPLTLRGLQGALVQGPMRRRHALALELAVRTSGRYILTTSTFASVQFRQMAAFEAIAEARAQRSPLARWISPIPA